MSAGTIKLRFPPLCGGSESGLNDAGIETFEGDFAKNVVRECAQNSLDAAASTDQPVSLSVTHNFLKTGDLPFLADLKKVLEACHARWYQNEKANRFFAAAVQLVTQNEINALKISDAGTTGVDGGDDDINGRWFGLVKSRGVSNQKEKDSGGAFGIGKDAPLVGSAFRTVLYSTKTLDGHVAFQGVCRLVSHKLKGGELTQGTGFIGDFDSVKKVYRAIRDPHRIPKRFLRTEPGLDIWVIGWRRWKTDAMQPFVSSALANFWPAIADGKISFRIGTQSISSANLGDMMRSERLDPEVQTALPFYQSLVDRHAKQFKKTLPNSGECRLHLLLARRELPKQICMVRRTGMVIEPYSPRVGFLPFSGLFVCEGAEGNRLLRSLEPPRHDKWDITRAEDPRAASALKEIREWIRDELRAQTPHADADEFNESEVPPDLLEDVPENPITDDSNQEHEPDLGGSPKEIREPPRVRIRTRDMQKTDEEGQAGTTEESGNVEDPKAGDGQNTGGRKDHKDEDDGKSSLTPKVPTLMTRAFCPSDGDGSHEVVLRCDGDYEGAVRLDALGDDGSAENITLESAEIVGVGTAEVEGNKIKNLAFRQGEVTRLRVRLTNRTKYALRGSLA
jgi:hypothetical protein